MGMVDLIWSLFAVDDALSERDGERAPPVTGAALSLVIIEILVLCFAARDEFL